MVDHSNCVHMALFTEEQLGRCGGVGVIDVEEFRVRIRWYNHQVWVHTHMHAHTHAYTHTHTHTPGKVQTQSINSVSIMESELYRNQT